MARAYKIGNTVSIPDRIIFPGRRDPYEWENGIINATGKNKKGDTIYKVKIWNHFTKKEYERWFTASMMQKVNFYHYIGEEEDFKKWLEAE
jgi:hypothetical protein